MPSDTFPIRFDVSSKEAIAWAKSHAAELATSLSETSRDDIKQAIAAALEGDGLDAAYDDILAAVGDEARADMIARTEIMSAANQGTLEAYSQAQEAGLLPANAMKEWIATSDACDICANLDGVAVGFDESFDFDGEDIDSPPGHPHCRCTTGIAAGDGA